MFSYFFSSIFQQLYNTVDTIIVGHTLGENALAAVGAAAPVYSLLLGFALGIGNGVSIVTARCFGAKDEEKIKTAVAASVFIGIAISLMVTVASMLLLKPFLEVLNTPEEILADAYRYASVIMLSTGITFAYNMCAGILRSVGDSVIPLIFLVISSVLNILLDLFFIRVLETGVQGAAIAHTPEVGHRNLVFRNLGLRHVGHRERTLGLCRYLQGQQGKRC